MLLSSTSKFDLDFVISVGVIRSACLTAGLLFGVSALSACSEAERQQTVSEQSAKARTTGMVVTANPHATRAGEAILKQGGSAVDAAVAIEAVLSLVEPQSSGLGGGGFMMYFDAQTKALTVYDGRETAPAGATPEMFLGDNGEPIPYLQAKQSGISIGVPGAVAMLDLAHQDHGALPWNTLFDSAKTLASEGFDVSPRLANFIGAYGGKLIPKTEEEGPLDAYRYFYDEQGKQRTRLLNPEYAETLEVIASDPAAFYTGSVAQKIAAAANLPPRAGTLTADDMARYQARRKDALCFDYRRLRACGPPPPSSWVGVGMMLGLLEATDFPSDDQQQDWATVAAAQQLAYADRDQYIADPDFVDLPLQGMLNKDYLASRAKLIEPGKALNALEPGNPWRFEPVETAKSDYGRDTTIDYAGTTHFVVMDNRGNVVSMTASVESIFGSSRMAGGMFLNNQLTDFARQPRDGNGELVANHAAPGKHPRSSMSPTIVLNENGEFFMATGSPGGNSILAYTLKTLVGVIDWGMTPQEAVDLPNMVARGETVRLESDRAAPGLIEGLRGRGFQIKESKGENSGLSVVVRTENGELLGGVDPRREGTIAIVQ